ncbi:MAG: hypothetical protein FWF50_02435 [Defluviitaleaceae bacterium]|nr:hypothetical protein [Defluviitaleaceae bacterium]
MIDHNDKRPVLYVAAIANYLPRFITARLSIHRDKKAVLMITKGMKNREYLPKFIEEGIFDEILFAETMAIQDILLKKEPEASKETIAEFVTNHYDEFLYANNHSLDDFSWVVTASDWSDWSMDIYCNLKKKKYMFFETLTNQFNSRGSRMTNTTAPIPNEGLKKLIVNLNSFNGRSPYCFPIYHESTTKFVPTDLQIKFLLKEEIKMINKEWGAKILKAYNYKWEAPKDDKQNVLFILHSWASNNNALKGTEELRKSFMEKPSHTNLFFVYTNQMALDYLTEERERVFIKAHPRDTIGISYHIQESYNEDIALTDFPSDFYEFEPSFKKFKFNTTIEHNASKYGIITSKPTEDNKNFKLTRNFAETVLLYNQIYFTLQMLQDKLLNGFSIANIKADHLYPIMEKCLLNLKEAVKIKEPKELIKKEAEILISRGFDGKLSDNVKIAVIYDIPEEPILENFQTIKFVISKEATKEKGRYANTNEESFYILCKDLKDAVLLKKYEDFKKLPRVGLNLKCSLAK